jgi:hypothetical protein
MRSGSTHGRCEKCYPSCWSEELWGSRSFLRLKGGWEVNTAVLIEEILWKRMDWVTCDSVQFWARLNIALLL